MRPGPPAGQRGEAREARTGVRRDRRHDLGQERGWEGTGAVMDMRKMRMEEREQDEEGAGTGEGEKKIGKEIGIGE